MKINTLALLAISVVVGAGLRLINLTSKPPWTDEFATLVFSSGNNYDQVPLNQIISTEVLLSPLRYNDSSSAIDVFHLLLDKDNHPPLYFMLAHWWLNLFPHSSEYISLWVMRSLPAILGVVSVLLAYFLGRLAFKSQGAGQLSAAMMAVSPYGVFISQEARHYNFGILWVMLSLICLLIASDYLQQRKYLPLSCLLAWVLINGAGLLTHYFFSLTLLSEFIALGGLLIYEVRRGIVKYNLWARIGLVWLGTAIIGLSWLVSWFPNHRGNGMTAWIEAQYTNIITLISPVFQLLAAWITMMALLPVEADFLPVIIVSALLMLWFFIKVIPPLWLALLQLLRKSPPEYPIWLLTGFIGCSVALFFSITYGLGLDITRGARYSFVYFPAVIIIVGGCLAVNWREEKKSLVILVLLMGLLSSLTVVFNLGYRKYYLSDRFVGTLSANSQYPVLIASTHESLVETGEMMGIAWVLKQESSSLNPRFILISEQPNSSATKKLRDTVKSLPGPLEVWAVNFHAEIDLPDCRVNKAPGPQINGYGYTTYICN